ncbi:MAG: isochorismatase family cysteine hydrolase, partial [Pyrinomonadaceae bacterium]
MSSSRLITSPTGEALLIVDMISHFEFEDGNKLFANTRRILEPLADLRSQLKSAGVPVIYVNDGIGEGGERRAHDLAELKVRSKKARLVLECLGPEPDDHWLVKPQRSGFYATGLSNLLHHLSVGSVIVAGVTTDICVFFTAHDAYMRGYSIRTPSNCCAAVEESHHE